MIDVEERMQALCVSDDDEPILPLAERLAQKVGNGRGALDLLQPHEAQRNVEEHTVSAPRSNQPRKEKSDPKSAEPQTQHVKQPASARSSARLTAPVGEKFIHWLTPQSGMRHASCTTFKRFDDVKKELHLSGALVRVQNLSDCVLYAAYNAIEVLCGPRPEPPPFLMKIAVPKEGMNMKTLLAKSHFLHYLQREGLKGEMLTGPFIKKAITPACIRRALEAGVVVIGTKLTAKVTAEKVAYMRGDLPDSMAHSICVVGYCEVRGKGYFIAKDSIQTGFDCSAVLLLGYKENTDICVDEMYVISPGESFAVCREQEQSKSSARGLDRANA